MRTDSAEAVMIRYDDSSPESFRIMLDEAKDWAERSGLTEDDIADAVKSVRTRRKA
ncbi:MAG: hypothetical protein IKQ95_10300 [Synergistaceae bacterium]|nr:hypothetical protein [Synergistaceae bacterium]